MNLFFFVALLTSAAAALAEAPAAAGAPCAIWPPRYLVLEGGAMKGVVRSLEETGALGHIQGFAGSSAGSIAATLLAAGLNAEQFAEQITSVDFSALKDRSSHIFADIRRVTSRFGMFKGEKIQETTERLLFGNTGQHNITFAQLRRHSGKRLRLTGMSLNTGRTAFFDDQRTPDMPVALAVRISSAIPVIFEPVHYDGQVYVDGGFLHNLPTDAFDDDGEDGSTLAVSLRPSKLSNLSRGEVDAYKHGEDGFVAYLRRLFVILLFGPQSSNSYVHLNDGRRASNLDVVVVPMDDVNPLDFSIDASRRVEIANRGYTTLQSHLADCGHPEAKTDAALEKN